MGAYLSLSIPVLIIAVAIQSSVIPQIRILGGGPDLVLLIVLGWSVHSDFDEALTWAFVGGIAQDLLSAAPIGASALGLIVIVFIVYILNRQLYRVGLLPLAVLAFLGTFIKEIMFAVVMAFVGMASNFLEMISYVILPSAIYNVALVWVVYWLIRRVQRQIRREDRITILK